VRDRNRRAATRRVRISTRIAEERGAKLAACPSSRLPGLWRRQLRLNLVTSINALVRAEMETSRR
jgi:hypothetical protein